MRTRSPQMLLLLGLVLASGCTVYQAPTKPGASPAELNLPLGGRNIYMEEETPAGIVPPPSNCVTNYSNPQAAIISSQPLIATANGSQGAVKRFAKAHADKGSPHIAVFLNRVISDDLLEWRTDVCLAAVQEDLGGILLTEKTWDVESTITHSNLSAIGTVSRERPTSSRTRVSQEAERWIWGLEVGFIIKPLLEAKAKRVDRTTILRLTAAAKSSGTQQSIAPQQIELNALKDYAEFVVDGLAAKLPPAMHGYEFKATAKEGNTGVILANVTSARWDSFANAPAELGPPRLEDTKSAVRLRCEAFKTMHPVWQWI